MCSLKIAYPCSPFVLSSCCSPMITALTHLMFQISLNQRSVFSSAPQILQINFPIFIHIEVPKNQYMWYHQDLKFYGHPFSALCTTLTVIMSSSSSVDNISLNLPTL